MIEMVETPLEISFKHPLFLTIRIELFKEIANGIMSASFRAETVGTGFEPDFPLRF
jgi:hypothetical protein